MNKHTPGPWVAIKISDEYDLLGVAFGVIAERQPYGTTYNDICSVLNRGGKEKTAANAHLIEAAPDLLAALEGLLHEYRIETMSEGRSEGDPDCREEVINARAAIAKARGSGWQ